MKKYSRYIMAIVCAIVCIASSQQVLAQEASSSPTPVSVIPEPAAGMNLTLSPTFINLVVDPGNTVTSQFKVRNNNNFKEYLHIQIQKFVAAEGGERPLISEITDQDEFGKWISFSEDQFSVSPNENKTIKFTITPPKSASLGYYYGISIIRVRENKGNGKVTAVTGAPTELVLLEVRNPNAHREIQLVDFKTTSPFYEYLPSEFQIDVKNTGNIHIIPTGDIFIDQGSTKNIAVIRANPGRSNVLPNTKRTYTTVWEDGFIVRTAKKDSDGRLVKDDKGNIVYETKWDLTKADKFRIGKYTAHLLMVYDNGQRDIPLEGTISFWVIPWKILGVAGIILLLVLFGIKNIVSSTLSRFKKN